MRFLAPGSNRGRSEDTSGAARADGRDVGTESAAWVVYDVVDRPSTGDPPASGEVLESGPGRPPGDRVLGWLAKDARRWLRGTTGPSGGGRARPWRRRAAAGVAALAVGGALVALRAGAPGIPVEEPVAAADAASGPVIIYGRARMQPPPFDRLPGRTPIPLPAPIGRPAEAVRGSLPATGTAGESAARAAVRLVLGRYCRYPRAYQILLEDRGSWREVTATVFSLKWVEPRRLTTVRLRWTGHAYSWQGWPADLARCA